ncbi:MAG: hypothetical protein ABI855_10725 [Bacteroidota bacterium]
MIYFLVTRIVLVFISNCVLNEFALHGHLVSEHKTFYENNLLNIWGNFDTGWYLEIAKNWYPHLHSAPAGSAFGQYSFFPLYPGLIRIIYFITGIDYFIVGLVISNICLLFSGGLLYRISEKLYTKEIAKWSVIFMYVFPVSFIFSGVFTEALYLLLILSSFYFAYNEKWFVSGSVSILITVCRPLGFLIALPLMYIYLKSKNFNLRKIDTNAFNFIGVPIGVILLLLLNYSSTGDPFMFLHNPGYGGKISNPFMTLYSQLQTNYFTLFFLALYSAVAILFWLFFYKHLQIPFHIVVFYSLFVPLSFGLMSMPRMTLAAFPLFILISSVACKYKAQNIFVIVLTLLQGFLFICWCFGFVTVV